MSEGVGPSGTYRIGRNVIITKPDFIDLMMTKVEPHQGSTCICFVG